MTPRWLLDIKPLRPTLDALSTLKRYPRETFQAWRDGRIFDDLTKLRERHGHIVDALETWVRYEHCKHRFRVLSLLEYSKFSAPREIVPVLDHDVYQDRMPPRASPDSLIGMRWRIKWGENYVADAEREMEALKTAGVKLCEAIFGPAQKPAAPVREIPNTLLVDFTMGGLATIEYNYLDATYPANWPLVYTDRELDYYMGRHRRDEWFIYGMTDTWVRQALAKYPILGMTVANVGSLTPWYESMILFHGAKPVTVDYNAILTTTDRVKTIREGALARAKSPEFDAALSISSFEHDGLGMYGDPLDPDGDIKAMATWTKRVKPGGLMYFAVPIGRDKILFNNARIYGRVRLPMMFATGWEVIETFGMTDDHFDGPGHVQPVFVLRNLR
jgi:hypothetical protein